MAYERGGVLSEVAGCRGRCGAPSGEACGSSQRGELREQVRALAAIRELVVTTDPLVVKMMLRDGGNSSFVKN
jgi:hypothetical protein